VSLKERPGMKRHLMVNFERKGVLFGLRKEDNETGFSFDFV